MIKQKYAILLADMKVVKFAIGINYNLKPEEKDIEFFIPISIRKESIEPNEVSNLIKELNL